MPKVRYQPLGPLLPGKTTSRAVLALQVPEDPSAEARPVVLVWLRDEATGSKELIAAVEKETTHAAILEHPNIIRVYGFSEQPEGEARVVEYADGETLRTVLKAVGKLPAPLAALIAADAATGLHYAHLAGNDDGSPLVHGDIRPETLLVGYSGITKVSGYGALAVAPREPGGRRVEGRRQHCAPEQVVGGRDAVHVQTDVYLLGLVLHECITGAVPFASEPDFDHAVLSQAVPDLPAESCPPALNEVIKKAMSKKSNERHPSALALREAIVAALGELPPHPALAAHLAGFFPEDQQARAHRRSLIARGRAQLAAMPPRPLPQPSAPPAPPPGAPVPVAATPPAPPPAPGKVAATGATPPLPPSPGPAAPVPAPVKKSGTAAAGWIVAALVTLVSLSLYALSRGAPPRLPDQAERQPVPQAAIPAADAGRAEAARGVVTAAPDGSALAAAPADAGGSPSAETAGVPDAGALAAAAGLPGPGAVDAGESALFLYVEPAVDVTIEGKPVGRTPLTVPLSPGRKLLKLSDKARNIATTRVVTVADKGTTTSRIYLQRGYVNVVAPPGAQIVLDGRKIGVAPQRELGVYEGPHELVVIVNGARWQRSFEARPNQHLKFEVTFQ